MAVLSLPESAGCAEATVSFFPSYYQQKLTCCFPTQVNNDDFLSRFRLLKNGREKVLNDIGTYNTRQSL